MKVPSSVALVSLLSLVDNVQSAITLPLKPIDKKHSAIIKQATKSKAAGTITVPVKDWIKHTADLQVYTISTCVSPRLTKKKFVVVHRGRGWNASPEVVSGNSIPDLNVSQTLIE